MYEVPIHAVNGGVDVAPEAHVDFDLAIKSRYCKICYIKIVQLTAGAMDVDFEVWESTVSRNAGLAVRTNLYLLKLTRSIELIDVQGGQYGENLNPPIAYVDRDTVDEGRTYQIHCKIYNRTGGTASDFDVSLKIADTGEEVV